MRASRLLRFGSDRRGIAAVEFALIAPALIAMVVGVLELSFRFRAGDEATRYAHQVADLIARENTLVQAELSDIYGAAPEMMMPLETTDHLDLDIASVGFVTVDKTPTMYWRRVGGTPVNFALSETEDMGEQDETVIRVGIRYRYESVVSKVFGETLWIERQAFARPRVDRVVRLDGQTQDGGAIKYFSAS